MKFRLDQQYGEEGDACFGLSLRIRHGAPGYALVLSWGMWEGAIILDDWDGV